LREWRRINKGGGCKPQLRDCQGSASLSLVSRVRPIISCWCAKTLENSVYSIATGKKWTT
jgi:hypothetical protein